MRGRGWAGSLRNETGWRAWKPAVRDRLKAQVPQDFQSVPLVGLPRPTFPHSARPEVWSESWYDSALVPHGLWQCNRQGNSQRNNSRPSGVVKSDLGHSDRPRGGGRIDANPHGGTGEFPFDGVIVRLAIMFGSERDRAISKERRLYALLVPEDLSVAL